MAGKIYGSFSLTGGGANSLDSIDGFNLENGDAAIVFTEEETYRYVLDSINGENENSPTIIKPDSNSGDKRWVLISDMTKGGVTIAQTLIYS